MEQYNDNYIRYIGFDETNACAQELFSPGTISMISKKITQLLIGVHPENRPIVVPIRTITSVISNIYDNYRPQTGDIYGRYNIPSQKQQSDVQTIIDRTIEIITSQIRNDYTILKNNSKLTIWNTVYGDFNEGGLRQHSPIKINNRRPNPMEFHMRY